MNVIFFFFLRDMWQKYNYVYQILMQFDRMERMKRERSEINWKQTESETWRDCLHIFAS